jgi:hypothetical protein
VKPWIGMTVAQVLAWCGTPYAEVKFIDEPPGKLRAIEFDCRRCEPEVRLTLEFEYHIGLFSMQREWERDVVTAQTVVRATETRSPPTGPQVE